MKQTNQQLRHELDLMRQRLARAEASLQEIREQAALSAMEQLKLAETIFNHSISSLVLLDRQYNFLRVNEAYARACRRDISEFAGRNHFEMYPSDAKAIFDEVVRAKRPFETFTRAFSFPDQPERGVTYWDWTLVPILDRQGEVEYLLFSLNDVTERKRAEEALRESEQRYREVFENSSDLIFLLDVTPEGRFRFSGLNPSVERTTGFVSAGLYGRFTDECLPEDLAWNLNQSCSRCLEAGGPVSSEGELIFPAGKGYFYTTLIPLKDAARLTYRIFGVSHNITERRKAMEAEIEKEAAVAANRTKSAFLANMSHELRTPLNSILGFSDLLIEGLAGPVTELQNEFIGYIKTSGRHLLSLINDILDLSKVEAGKMQLEPGPVSVTEVLAASLVMQKEKAMKHGIRLSLEMEPGSEIEIEADERKLKQVVFNLLSNAVKFTPDGGSVTVRSRLVPCDERNGQDCLEISVQDSGMGIRREDMPKLFQEFTQLQEPLTKRDEGTGLGLALSKKLVELHGGRIWAESEYGKGSTFSFVVPLRTPGGLISPPRPFPGRHP